MSAIRFLADICTRSIRRSIVFLRSAGSKRARRPRRPPFRERSCDGAARASRSDVRAGRAPAGGLLLPAHEPLVLQEGLPLAPGPGPLLRRGGPIDPLPLRESPGHLEGARRHPFDDLLPRDQIALLLWERRVQGARVVGREQPLQLRPHLVERDGCLRQHDDVRPRVAGHVDEHPRVVARRHDHALRDGPAGRELDVADPHGGAGREDLLRRGRRDGRAARRLDEIELVERDVAEQHLRAVAPERRRVRGDAQPARLTGQLGPDALALGVGDHAARRAGGQGSEGEGSEGGAEHASSLPEARRAHKRPGGPFPDPAGTRARGVTRSARPRGAPAAEPRARWWVAPSLALRVLSFLDELADPLASLVTELRISLRPELLLARLATETARLADGHRASGPRRPLVLVRHGRTPPSRGVWRIWEPPGGVARGGSEGVFRISIEARWIGSPTTPGTCSSAATCSATRAARWSRRPRSSSAGSRAPWRGRSPRRSAGGPPSGSRPAWRRSSSCRTRRRS